MRKTTDRSKKTVGAVLAAGFFILIVLACLAFLLLPLLPLGTSLWAAVIGVVVLCVLPLAAVLIGVVAVLIQRLREIEGGEEDEAKKY